MLSVFCIYFPKISSLINRAFPVYKVTGLSLEDFFAAGSRTFLFATTSEMPVELRLIIFGTNWWDPVDVWLGQGLDRRGIVFQFMTEIENCFFLEITVTATEPTLNSIQWIRRPGHEEANHLLVANPGVTNVRNGTSTSPYSFIPWFYSFYFVGIWFCTTLYVSSL